MMNLLRDQSVTNAVLYKACLFRGGSYKNVYLPTKMGMKTAPTM